MTKEELEKENAELKKVKQVKIEVTRDYKKLAKDLQEQGNQLTKAKELLAKWVELFKPKVGNIPPTPIQVATEQFLKESK